MTNNFKKNWLKKEIPFGEIKRTKRKYYGKMGNKYDTSHSFNSCENSFSIGLFWQEVRVNNAEALTCVLMGETYSEICIDFRR